MKPATTAIAAYGETWHVPRGFGAEYRRCVAWRKGVDPARRDREVSDLLGLVGYEVSPETVGGWSNRERVDAEVWAAREHLTASDVPLPRCPRPDWLPEPWMGPEGSATPLRADREAA